MRLAREDITSNGFQCNVLGIRNLGGYDMILYLVEQNVSTVDFSLLSSHTQ